MPTRNTNQPQPAPSKQPRRMIDLTEDDLRRIVLGIAFEATNAAKPQADDPNRAMPKADVARFLGVSVSQIDILSRRSFDPLPYTVVGEVRRFLRLEVIEWVKRQREVAA
jgi:hypothetical protein